MKKTLLLGTAQWGWTVTASTAFQLLDAWLLAGHRDIDCATNYPINRVPDDFRGAERILLDYIKAHGIRDLQVTMKIGGLDNMRSPEPNLNPSFIQMMAHEYERLLGPNLDCLMLHWDNRQDEVAIFASLEVLARLESGLGIRPGLSGIKFPDCYQAAMEKLDIVCDIQLKHNLLASDIDRYIPVLSPDKHRYFAYGINAGGLKLAGAPYPAHSTFLARGGQAEKSTQLLLQLANLVPTFNENKKRAPIKSMNQLGMIYAGLNPAIQGMVLGFSGVAQLEDSLAFWRAMGDGDYEDVYLAL